jgi:hypothetical protein
MGTTASIHTTRRNGRGPLPPMDGSLTRDAAARDRGTPPCAGPRCQPTRGDDPVATCTVLLLPYTSADKEQHLSTCNGHAQHHARDHTHRDALVQTHADSDVLWARRPRDAHATLTCCWYGTRAARVQLGWSRAHRGVACAGRIQAASGRQSTHPTHPPPEVPRPPGVRQPSGSAGPARRPMHAAWRRMEHALMPPPPCSPTPSVPRHTWDNHLHGRIACVSAPQGVTRRHRTCSLAQQPGSTSGGSHG